MISYHPSAVSAETANRYFKGFRTVPTNDTARLAKGITNYVWSPIIWREGHRKQANFEAAHWCVLDFDDGAVTLDDAKNLWCDCIHLIGTTKSHQKEKNGVVCDRFRVAILFDEPITDLRLYRWNLWRLLKHEYPEADPACKDGARFFYPCLEIVSQAAEGEKQEVYKDIPETFDCRPDPIALKEAGIIPRWALSKLQKPIPAGERNTTIFRVAKDLAQAGIEPNQIQKMVMSSATYQNVEMTYELLAEIAKAVKSGIRSAGVK